MSSIARFVYVRGGHRLPDPRSKISTSSNSVESKANLDARSHIHPVSHTMKKTSEPSLHRPPLLNLCQDTFSTSHLRPPHRVRSDTESRLRISRHTGNVRLVLCHITLKQYMIRRRFSRTRSVNVWAIPSHTSTTFARESCPPHRTMFHGASYNP